MRTTNNTNAGHVLFALVPTVPSIFFGLAFVWLRGASSTNVSSAFLLVLFSLVSGYFMWVWHHDQLTLHKNYYQRRNLEEINKLMAYTVELEKLLLQAEPKFVEHVSAAKEITEREVSTLIRRFSVIHNELNVMVKLTNQSPDGKESETHKTLKDSADKIRSEVDVVLEALQFQDRVSQILALVQGNFTALRESIELIQQQGHERHQNMLNVEEAIAKMQTQYETVKHRHNRAMPKHSVDDFTLF